MERADVISGVTVDTLRQALREAEATHYQLLELTQAIPAWPIAN